MGVPKFYRWLSERYPKIMQRRGVRPDVDRAMEHLGRTAVWMPQPQGDLDTAAEGTDKKLSIESLNLKQSSLPLPDPLSESGLFPEIDRLYIDMNGIIHGCSHSNQTDTEGTSNVSMQEICSNVCYYLDRVVKEVAKPNELVYMAIDGVAPRAKLNQQRARRYRSGKEGEIERTVYDAHVQAMEKEKLASLEEQSLGVEQEELRHAASRMQSVDDYETLLDHESIANSQQQQEHEQSSFTSSNPVKELQDGRFTGKFETQAPAEIENDDVLDESATDSSTATTTNKFHSNAITPGTPFFQECTERILEFIQDRIKHDDDWSKLQVIFSGPNVPGEGEHKIMQFIREQRSLPDYNPNLRHCIMGQDGDLIMLGLATHEPNLMLLREQVLFDKRAVDRDDMAGEIPSLDFYLFNANFELLHMNVLRDYLAYELETILPDNPFCLERSIDDFVFLTFLVGNDFLPHMPALDIADEAFDLLFYTYRALRKQWVKQSPKNPYLTNTGNIVSGKRLEGFLAAIGAHEGKYYDYKDSVVDLDVRRAREIKYGRPQTPSDAVLERKEESDRMRYRAMVESAATGNASLHSDFTPVLSAATLSKDDKEHERQVEQLHKLLQLSVSDTKSIANVIDDTDLKGRYYADKFDFSPFDADKHIALRKAYMEGLVWNLKYYYEGCVSWEWYYPYHYGPFMSDLVGLDDLLAEITFEGKLGAPLKPFEQLLACLPPSHAHLLPKPYRRLMRNKTSPIADFYPPSFVIDMNGKRLPWEAVVLLPFIDSNRLINAASAVEENTLTDEERQRNSLVDTIVMSSSVTDGGDERHLSIVPFATSQWKFKKRKKAPVLHPKVLPGTETPLPGLPTLRDGSITGLWRKYIPLNVHGGRSRYKIACLEMQNAIPEIIPLDAIARQFIGTAVVINYPHFIEGLVTAVSDSSGFIRGTEHRLVSWTAQELADRKNRAREVVASYVVGEKLVGTGGLALAAGRTAMEDLDVLMFVRPLKELKTLRDGTVGKVYAKYEVEVPLFVTSWAPHKPDPRLAGLPAFLEKDPYHKAELVVTHRQSLQDNPNVTKKGGNAYVFPAPRGLKRDRKRSTAARGLHTNAHGLFSFNGTDSVNHLCIGAASPTRYLQKEFVQHCPLPLRARQWGPRGQATTPVLFNRPAKLRACATAPQTRFLAGGIMLAGLLLSFTSGAAASRDVMTHGGAHALFQPATRLQKGHGYSQAIDDSNTLSSWPKSYDAAPPLQFEHGTTTLSFIFEHGMIVAVDSRASLGSFVGSKTVEKVLPIHSHMLGTMAGGAADCSFWIRKIRAQAKLHELQYDGERLSVTRASRMLANALYENRALGLSVGTMMVGYDGSKAKIFYVDNTGMRMEGDMFSVGSGSTYALGILDTERRWNMSVEEAVSLGIKAIRHATFRDAGSGGWINVYLITKKDGWKHVFAQDLAGLIVTTDEVRGDSSA
ncbi:hypothetical protein MPSEU_000752100 [Mayamaea pseudoterrestris]|nr:hypothetical protein MPSEU_000752100 [Mayamaea pseudoterrestris]